MSEEIMAPEIPKAKLSHRHGVMRSWRTKEASKAVKIGMLSVNSAALEASDRSIPQAKITEPGIKPNTVAMKNGKKFLPRKRVRGCGCSGWARLSRIRNGIRQMVPIPNVSRESNTGPIFITAALVAGY